jgi:hypothetical protein
MIGGCFRTVVAFHYGNLTHPSVDPPRIGFLSIVPNNASQLLTDAVKSAQQNGNFEGALILLITLPLFTHAFSQPRLRLHLLGALLLHRP